MNMFRLTDLFYLAGAPINQVIFPYLIEKHDSYLIRHIFHHPTGQHPSNQIVVDQHKNPSTQLDKDGNVAAITQQEMTVKEDNSND